ncbi:hypothetical protein HanRHA438_Chr12g0569111 [Helianthus annuus]|uniref:Putative TPX2 domain-containing protein n=1 Tax=Helianthus annuus TaxID=4232 RepID=A0A251T4E9_HELAN|nr:protein WVD2-like 2 [Helianthus annuus]XP_021998753.1 protein WVD2-like 2 [Helianthus annuus]XP_021998754.1 protein WVD2-like 2 [Helianthus annuus]XP_021998755.1 protein WVD2-like 2 [Helianthus annuus]XP_021998756.1 protein WVD2-like 2 [Helianthus annuus]XP_021998757.1 protein WVD2-like 2 [Helianthus annuus]KAF5779301.1 hypothetical protein HanXRQr2_Chr12g0557761 [Helianthus annuus]KAJ0490585.1 putative protein WAVE-DAMPENED 2 [Helianthus annuus]KAJ0506505.1 putative protein WAVE-DAMPENE
MLKSNGNSPKASGGESSVNIVETSVEKQESVGKTPNVSEKIIGPPPENGLHNTNSFRSPINNSQGSPFSAAAAAAARVHKSYSNKYPDEEDNWSVASSAATSRTVVRSRVTVGIAPSFRSAQRAAQRKEYYTKLEQKHEALKAEKMEYEARTKEEQEEAIRQLRKSMVVKANPVPSFYRQGPPPKVELKKLPLTRAKSPNLTRRKSCGDTTPHSTADEKALCSKVRHSLGSYSATSSPIKQTQGRNIKPKDRTIKPPNETPKVSHLKAFK